MIKKFKKINMKTDHPHPLMSPDYLIPAGSVEDNHTNTSFIWEIDTLFQGQPYKLLDIGCAGGQFVVDIYNKGYPWVGVGLEGGNVYGMTEKFEEQETEEGGRISIARGSENWKHYKDECLFHADVSKPFEILDEDGELVKFDIVTAWEFFEHPAPEEIPHIIQNIKKHLKGKGNGLVIGTINMSPGVHHRCARSIEWWNAMFADHGFTAHNYPFKRSPRTSELVCYDSALQRLRSEGLDVKSVVDESVQRTEYNYPACFVLAE